jgi:cytochrome c-type biogenesis protein CcmE
MTRKRRRLYALLFGLALIAGALALALSAFRDTLVFFYSPTELIAKHVAPGQSVRIGGLVETGSLSRPGGGTILFKVTDLKQTVPVSYIGLLPDLFREGQGVVVEGKLNAAGVFIADQVLAKHDERYMPPEVAAALKKSGRWQETTGAQP